MSLPDELSRCREWIEAALGYGGGTHDFNDVVDAISTGHMQLWPADDGCLVTEIVKYPRKTVLHIFLAGGRMGQITDMHDDVIAWAKTQGCESLTLAGRKGWVKALAPYGWNQNLVVLEKRF